MAGFAQNGNAVSTVLQLRNQGLTDDLIMDEMARQGFRPETVSQALSQADGSADMGMASSSYGRMGMMPPSAPLSENPQNYMYSRMEDIAENLIDEKWDQLLGEVKKIIEWKERVESTQAKLISDVGKLQDDFKLLHGGVLGKLEDYDARMRDVGVELKAVGKVFKDVVPQFVENVKALSSIKDEMRKK